MDELDRILWFGYDLATLDGSTLDVESFPAVVGLADRTSGTDFLMDERRRRDPGVLPFRTTNSMLTTHGRGDDRGKSWLTTPLTVSGLALVVFWNGSPANACHITHHKVTTEPSTPTPTSPSLTPEQTVQQALQKLLNALPAQPPAPASPSTTLTATASPLPIPTIPVAAAQVLMPTPANTTPSVANWHQSTPTTCMPPTPPSTSEGSPVTASAQVITPSSAPLLPPGQLLVPPTPAPEPSTLLIAGLLAGAFAWKRRRN